MAKANKKNATGDLTFDEFVKNPPKLTPQVAGRLLAALAKDAQSSALL